MEVIIWLFPECKLTIRIILRENRVRVSGNIWVNEGWWFSPTYLSKKKKGRSFIHVSLIYWTCSSVSLIWVQTTWGLGEERDDAPRPCQRGHLSPGVKTPPGLSGDFSMGEGTPGVPPSRRRADVAHRQRRAAAPSEIGATVRRAREGPTRPTRGGS